MRRLLLAAAVGGTALMSGYGTAAAQVAIEIPGLACTWARLTMTTITLNSYGRSYDRDYRYYGDRHRTRGHERSDRNICGRNAYWDGDACQPGRRP